MIKKIVYSFIMFLCVLVVAGCNTLPRDAGAASPGVSAGIKARVSPKKLKNLLDDKRAELEDSQWDIEVTSQEGAGYVKDMLNFEDEKFISREFTAKGFGPVAYSLTYRDSGVFVFETMQESEVEGTVFWRGEFGPDGDVIRGTISQVYSDGKTKDLFFSGIKMREDKL
ncbi:MAG TPA: hypothetical protein DCL35_05460 [Candidatus Omnitrophica bacterium]|nr:hypothetical protein [Candidatus Omnitrophota bacterium]